MDFSGKVALVTGGSMGIGKATVLEFAKAGTNVAFTYRSHGEEAKDIVAQAESYGVKALSLEADVADFKRAGEVVSETIETLGGLDFLINNAGMNWDGVIWKMEEEQWDRVIDVDLKGCFNFLRAATPHLRNQMGGSIVNVTSINGLRGKFGQSNYTAAKGGVIALTKTVAREMGRSDVNVNAIAPGLIETEMVSQAVESVKQKALEEIILGRLGQPAEVGQAIIWLCSPMARHITGQVINVDGGQYL
ncbi:MAG TPA: 3-oxoacyl-ACP reductase FabG [Candidatus Thalassarchaeaceae archaeon]|nr:beta-ketoacyl-ACP reductase [Euryarchaeota archaeon]DAC51788.1 MAG TPA: 3-oxoacyl-ACP reductase FabG [Candidatus Poseidoniales archaeon]HIH82564.1 3-oxoacyl-ACP reductase FabG [Candidatus Thalassarchaeaceae archaeon]